MEPQRHQKCASRVNGHFLDDSHRDLHFDLLQLVYELDTDALTDPHARIPWHGELRRWVRGQPEKARDSFRGRGGVSPASVQARKRSTHGLTHLLICGNRVDGRGCDALVS